MVAGAPAVAALVRVRTTVSATDTGRVESNSAERKHSTGVFASEQNDDAENTRFFCVTFHVNANTVVPVLFAS